MNELDRAAIAWLTESDNDDTRALRAHVMEMLAMRDAEIERLRKAIKEVCKRTEFSDGEVDMDLCECMDCCTCCVDLRRALEAK